ncbi:MAG: hypothetical protein R2702_05295 [Acidimicrobiales bacterium]
MLICTPDKDLGQCVGGKVFQLDRRKGQLSGVDEVAEKFGVPPPPSPTTSVWWATPPTGSRPAGLGAKSAATVLARYGRLEDIPVSAADWDVTVRGAAKLAATLQEQYDDALLFRLIATINTDAPTIANVDELRWTGPKPELAEVARRLDAPSSSTAPRSSPPPA